MSKTKIALLIGGICMLGGVLFVGIMFMWGLGLRNQAAGLQNQYDMKVKANGAVFDNMFKKIGQSAQVTDAQKEAIKEIVTGYAAARAGNGGGSLATSVKEVVPNVDVSVYRNLQNIITGARDEWTANQIQIVSIAEQYNRLLAIAPGSLLLDFMGFKKIDPKVITSTRTEEAFRTGKDDDTELFPKKK